MRPRKRGGGEGEERGEERGEGRGGGSKSIMYH